MFLACLTDIEILILNIPSKESTLRKLIYIAMLNFALVSN